MTDRLALILGAIVLAAFGIDLATGGSGTMFLARKVFGLVEYLRFWS
jgi:hypothetical protein